jgi:sugar O-acyltransferase (sialic acid O-acetyltransferase NeuD family)
MTQPLLVLGAGGHAKVVIDAALRCGRVIEGVLDDDATKHGHPFYSTTVLGPIAGLDRWSGERLEFVVAVGGNSQRQRLQLAGAAAGLRPAVIVHPNACVARTASVGDGSVLFAGAIVNADARVGLGVIINTGASIDHDCMIGDWVHVGPGVAICGGVHVGEATLVGVGARIIPGVTIGKGCLIAAGAVVCRDLPDYARVAGVPARPMETKR